MEAGEFAALMARCGPFGPRPRLAVAISGGSDSMALALLVADWARGRGGTVLALTVDHGLRPESAAEAAQVGGWLATRGIPQQVLAWTGAKPATGIQAAARDARRALLLAACRAQGIVHLLLAHQRDDQDETVAMRAARGSGPDGCAGMALVVETAHVRLLRPLLPVPRRRLMATLAAAGQGWVDDPSNRDTRFLRARLRAGGAPLTAATPAAGRARMAREAALAAVLARHVAIHPAGWAQLDPAILDPAAVAPDLAIGTLARVVTAIGGGAWPPRGERLRLAYARMAAGPPRGSTLGGCRLLPRPAGWLVVRELAAVETGCPLPADGGEVLWDGRFAIRLGRPFPGRSGHLSVSALGCAGWSALVRRDPGLRSAPVPAAVRPSLPAVWDLDGVCAVPHLLYRRQDQGADSFSAVYAQFRPRHALADAGFLAG